MTDPAAERVALQKRGDQASQTVVRGLVVTALVPVFGAAALVAALAFPGLLRAMAVTFGALAVLVTGSTGTLMILGGALQKRQVRARLRQLDQLQLPPARLVER